VKVLLEGLWPEYDWMLTGNCFSFLLSLCKKFGKGLNGFVGNKFFLSIKKKNNSP